MTSTEEASRLFPANTSPPFFLAIFKHLPRIKGNIWTKKTLDYKQHLEKSLSDLRFTFSRVVFTPLTKCFLVIHETHTRTKAASIRGQVHLPQAIISNTNGQVALLRATARITKGLLPLHQIQIRENCTRTGMTRIPTRLAVSRTKIHLQHLLCHQVRWWRTRWLGRRLRTSRIHSVTVLKRPWL